MISITNETQILIPVDMDREEVGRCLKIIILIPLVLWIKMINLLE